jgi:hypothetical protein
MEPERASGESTYEAEERRDVKLINTLTDRHRIPGSDPVSFATMLNDTRAPPHVGPLLWAALVTMMYSFRHNRNASMLVWACTIMMHITYTEYKRQQSTRRQVKEIDIQIKDEEANQAASQASTPATPLNATALLQSSALLPPPAVYARKIASLTAKRTSIVSGKNNWWRRVLYILQACLFLGVLVTGGSWLYVVFQVLLCGMFFLDHSAHISQVRKVYCEFGNNGPMACRLQR